ncbi:hypothetical protein Scep_010083 [Stephania cephalantha]|uniref:Endonuclease/exonuclease/phosphatase domain-containing protein n=1 Tax=Stephania cephalantha TaxID=152367 RepID=A0AAP0JWU0_9MAGN
MMLKEDKRGGPDRDESLLRGFCDAVMDNGLIHTPLIGYNYTWERGRCTPRFIEERLDRAMVSDSWLSLHPNATLRNLTAPTSDHSPILLNLTEPLHLNRPYHFRFENAWLKEKGATDLITNSWGSAHEIDIRGKLNNCALALRTWGKRITGNFKQKIHRSKLKIEELRTSNSPNTGTELQKVKSELGNLLDQEEIY